MSQADPPETSAWGEPARLPAALAAAWAQLEARCRKLSRQKRLSVDAIHQLRRSCRALEAAVLLVAPGDHAQGQRARRRLRRLRRKAGALRDLDVALQQLERLRARPRFAPLALALRRPLARRRSRSQARLLRFLERHPRGGLAGAGRALTAALERQPADPWSALGRLELALFQQRRESARDPEALHRLRIAGKKVRWARRALRLEAPGQDPLAELVAGLGQAHDLWVTCSFLERLLPGDTPAEARRALERLRGMAYCAHRRVAERWLAPAPDLGLLEPAPLSGPGSAFPEVSASEPESPAVWQPSAAAPPPAAPDAGA